MCLELLVEGYVLHDLVGWGLSEMGEWQLEDHVLLLRPLNGDERYQFGVVAGNKLWRRVEASALELHARLIGNGEIELLAEYLTGRKRMSGELEKLEIWTETDPLIERQY